MEKKKDRHVPVTSKVEAKGFRSVSGGEEPSAVVENASKEASEINTTVLPNLTSPLVHAC